MFVIEQALSVRALQELVTAAGDETVSCILPQKLAPQILFINKNSPELTKMYNNSTHC